MKVLVVASHPDDECLGCGATMAKHIILGDQVKVLIMADGVSSRPDWDIMQRRAECVNANMCLGVSDITLLSYPDNRIGDEHLLHMARDIEAVLADYKADTLYTHSQADLNLDHRTVGQAAITACRPQSGVTRILCFEIPSSTEWGLNPFRPNWFEDISGVAWRAKYEAIQCYQSELRTPPHPRSLAGIEHLANWRGMIAGCHKAEAFELYRMME
jgi:LmbE family N-acetylglucosaminyl deacetylase